ncbi:MAG: ammonia channel protein [Acidobacteria bacterium]|nr:ammonia channel protein [Acidobacteriota bacterium]
MKILMPRIAISAAATVLLVACPRLAAAQTGPDTGDTAWMLTSSILVLFMTIPGLALFYAGLVRAKNVLSVMMQCFAITCMVTLLWTVYGYGLAFGDGGVLNSVIGSGNILLSDIGLDTARGTIPESVFQIFQLTFAVVTPALIVGAFAERMKFSAALLFMALWVTLVYTPIAHWVWGGGFLGEMGVLDFAGGIVVHVNAGIAALVLCILLGERRGYPNNTMAPNSLVLTVVGASMLWIGWFGFNAGSALSAGGSAGFAMMATQISAASGGMTWMLFEWLRHGKPSVLGIATGSIAGLVAISPAAGFVGPTGALMIGLISASLCFWGANGLKRRFGYDDSLDVFGVHGIGGGVGTLLTAVFASNAWGGLAGNQSFRLLLGVQAIGVMVTVIYSGILTLTIVKIVDKVVGLRVTPEEEGLGLDLSLHDERGFNL